MLFIIYMQNIISSFYRSRTRTACFFTYRVFIKCCVFRKTTIFKTLGPSLTFCGISLASVCTQDRHSANWFPAGHTIFIHLQTCKPTIIYRKTIFGEQNKLLQLLDVGQLVKLKKVVFFCLKSVWIEQRSEWHKPSISFLVFQ